MKKEIIKEIIKEGLKNGGFTVDHEGKKAEFKTGFVVSELGFEKSYIIDNKMELVELESDIMKYAEIAEKNDAFIGGWINDGVFFLDISKVYFNKKEALKAGRRNRQLAIYDIKNGCDIMLIKTFYTIHEVKRDFWNVAEFNTMQELESTFNIKNGYQYVIKDVDDLKQDQPLLKDKYIIMKNEI